METTMCCAATATFCGTRTKANATGQHLSSAVASIYQRIKPLTIPHFVLAKTMAFMHTRSIAMCFMCVRRASTTYASVLISCFGMRRMSVANGRVRSSAVVEHWLRWALKRRCSVSNERMACMVTRLGATSITRVFRALVYSIDCTVNGFFGYTWIFCILVLDYRTKCPENLVWNEVKKGCDWSDSIKCHADRLYGNAVATYCSGRQNGKHAHGIYCNRYYVCQNGKDSVFTCQNNLRYNENKEECDWAVNVDCNGKKDYMWDGIKDNFCRSKVRFPPWWTVKINFYLTFLSVSPMVIIRIQTTATYFISARRPWTIPSGVVTGWCLTIWRVNVIGRIRSIAKEKKN